MEMHSMETHKTGDPLTVTVTVGYINHLRKVQLDTKITVDQNSYLFTTLFNLRPLNHPFTPHSHMTLTYPCLHQVGRWTRVLQEPCSVHEKTGEQIFWYTIPTAALFLTSN